MRIRVYEDAAALSRDAAADAARLLREAIAGHGNARLVAATGTSQIAFLEALCAEPSIAWDRVELWTSISALRRIIRRASYGSFASG
jgi:glucosamine-6-phosphate deaminase